MSETVEQTAFTGCLSRDFVFSIDAQGRMAIPAEWRACNGSAPFMLIPGAESTLQLYPAVVFNERIMVKVKKLSPNNPVDQRKQRYFFSRIFSCECDKQGRIQLPAKLLEYAKLEKRAALIGSGDFAQIMSAERWEDEKRSMESCGEDFLDILG